MWFLILIADTSWLVGLTDSLVICWLLVFSLFKTSSIFCSIATILSMLMPYWIKKVSGYFISTLLLAYLPFDCWGHCSKFRAFQFFQSSLSPFLDFNFFVLTEMKYKNHRKFVHFIFAMSWYILFRLVDF